MISNAFIAYMTKFCLSLSDISIYYNTVELYNIWNICKWFLMSSFRILSNFVQPYSLKNVNYALWIQLVIL